jgi:PDDEXK-like domain of unknown function (DUF3799)
MTVITEPGVYPDIPDAIYHADPVAGGSLSSTGAKRILDSPARFQWEQEHRVEKHAYDVGHAVHSRVLGAGMFVRVLDFDSWRTKDSQVARDVARELGEVPMLRKDYEPVFAMSEAVLAHPVARALLEKPGQSEVSMFAPDPDTGVWLRARIDRLPDEGPCVDLKTARSADPRQFSRSAAEYAYDIQSAWYQHVLRLARGDKATTFQFVVVETEAPHLVSVIELDSEFAAIGRARMRRAIETFRACREADEWPGYEPTVHYVDAPRWLAYEEDLVI